MSVSEQDLELLETWLDGELPEEQSELLRRRLSAEPELSQAMDHLRSERATRTQIWHDLEPSDTQAESLVAEIRRAIVKHEVWAVRFRTLRSVSGIAASIAIVFLAGWMSRSRLQVGPTSTAALTNSTQVANNNVPISNNTNPNIAVPVPGNPSNVFVSAPSNPANVMVNARPEANGLSRLRPTYKVLVLDPFGRLLHTQELDKLEDAQKFTEELGRWQMRQQPRASDNVLPVTDHP